MTTTATGVRHLKMRFGQSGFALEPCEDRLCHVDEGGHAGCGRLACPSCGYGGNNLSTQYVAPGTGQPVACSCGHTWIAEGG
jgi:hypothetical protein